jgi:hypothetical protein
MVEFKKGVKKALPYDREEYIDFFGNHFYSYTEWFAVSFQLPGGFEGIDISLTEYLAAYEKWFQNAILQLDNTSFWIVNHDQRDAIWFPNEDDSLPSLRNLFKENNIPHKFKGALIFTTQELLEFSNELITYPFGVFSKHGLLYNDLAISHSELPFIIKISHHCNIDFLTTDKELLRKVLDENHSSLFVEREYRGTSLL